MIAVIIALLAAAVVGYHVYLSLQLPGEARVFFSLLPIIGDAVKLGQDPVRLFSAYRQRAGEVFGMVVMGQRMFFLTEPESFKVVLRADKSKLSFDRFTDRVLERVFNVNLHTVHNIFDEPFLRSVYQKYLLSESSLAAMLTKMQGLVGELLMDVSEGTYDDMYDFVRRVTFQAAVGSLFNRETGKDEQVYQAFLKFDDLFAAALSGIPYSVVPAANKARELLLEKTFQAREEVSAFIAYRFQVFDEWKMPAGDIAGSQLAMLWASAGNTMPGAFWTVYHVMKNPDALAAVTKELNDVIGDKMRACNLNKQPLQLTAEEIDRLVILDSCISEALRLSAGSLLIRECVVPQTIELPSGNRYTFRKGDLLGISPIIVHTDPRHYEAPEEFRHDRFINGAGGKPFLPFGAGTSYCPGRRFARGEIKCIVATLLARFDVEILDGKAEIDGSRAGIGIFPPKGKIRMNLKAKQL